MNKSAASSVDFTCVEEGCNRLAPDPGKMCDNCLRLNSSYVNRVDWYGYEDRGLDMTSPRW